MRFAAFRIAATAALLAIFLVSSCSEKTEKILVSPNLGSMLIHFDHTVGGSALVLGGSQFDGTDGAGNAYSVDRLRYFVSNIRLHRASSGSVHATDDYHYRDASDAATRDYSLNNIPEGAYDAVSFTFGLDDQMNYTGNGIEADLQTAGMEWPPNWGGGWHYLIFEGFYDPANSYPFRTHLGRRFIAASGDGSGQGPDSVSYHHFFTVRLYFASPITINGNNWETAVTMELDDWYASPIFDLASFFPGGVGGIMVNLTAQKFLQQNGLAAFSGTQPALR